MNVYVEVERLWGEGKSVGEIALELNLRKRLLQRILNDMGIPRLERMKRARDKMFPPNPELDNAVVEARRQGLSYQEIIQKFHVSNGQAHRILQAAGLISGVKHQPAKRRPKCCACGILQNYCDRVDEIQCGNCTFDGCTHRRKKGMMCGDCQTFLNVKPLGAGNQAAPSEGG